MCIFKHDLKPFIKVGKKNELKMWIYSNGILDQDYAVCKVQGVHAFKSSSTENTGWELKYIFLLFCYVAWLGLYPFEAMCCSSNKYCVIFG